MPLPAEYFDLDILIREPTTKTIVAGDTESCESCGCATDHSECMCPSDNCPSETETLCMDCTDDSDKKGWGRLISKLPWLASTQTNFDIPPRLLQ